MIKSSVWVRIDNRMRNVDEGEWYRKTRRSRLERARELVREAFNLTPILEPAQEEQVNEEQQVNEVPAQEEPTQEEPAQEDQVNEEPAHEETVHEEEELSNERHVPYVEHPLQRDLDRITRALTQPRIHILEIDFRYDTQCIVQIHGAEDTCYEVTIQENPQCTCPDRRFRGVSCKHILHVLMFLFFVPYDNYLLYQRRFTEREVFELISPFFELGI